MHKRTYLQHHGIKGQRWGIRRTPEELGRHVYLRRSKMSIDEYKHACDLWRKHHEIDYWPDSKSTVLSKFTSNLSDDDKEKCIVHTNCNNHRYTAINKGYEQYKVIRAKRIRDSYTDLTDYVMSNVIGDDWRRYDD